MQLNNLPVYNYVAQHFNITISQFWKKKKLKLYGWLHELGRSNSKIVRTMWNSFQFLNSSQHKVQYLDLIRCTSITSSDSLHSILLRDLRLSMRERERVSLKCFSFNTGSGCNWQPWSTQFIHMFVFIDHTTENSTVKNSSFTQMF